VGDDTTLLMQAAQLAKHNHEHKFCTHAVSDELAAACFLPSLQSTSKIHIQRQFRILIDFDCRCRLCAQTR
jgi:hypothetical protein